MQYILTSATLGGPEADEDILTFAHSLCDVEFKQSGIIRSREKRPPMAEHRDFPPELFRELRQSPETLERYPFEFVFRVRHQLIDNGFRTQFEVRNPGRQDLLFCVGAHTGINCPLREGERFEDYRLVFDEVEDAPSIVPSAQGYVSAKRERILDHTDTIALDHAVFDRLDTIIFEGLRSKGVTLRHKDGGRSVHMEFGEFPLVAFWTMPNANAPYICLEPWHGCAAVEGESGELADKPHVIRLAPGGEKKLNYTVELR